MSQPMHANDAATFNAPANMFGATVDASGLASPAGLAFGSQESLLDFSSQELREALAVEGPVDPAACGLSASALAPPGNAYAPPNVPDPLGQMIPPEDLVLKLVGQGVHKVVRNEAGSPLEYIVSDSKVFVLRLELRHRDTGLLAMAEGNRLDVRATLLYENGNAVPPRGEDDKLLLGETEVTVIGGEAKLKLKMGAHSLSAKHDGRRFRIRIEPRDDALRPEAFPQLSVTGTPFKSVTKTERGNAEQRAARAQVQLATPTPGVAGMPGVTPTLPPTPIGGSGAAPIAGVSPQEYARLRDELDVKNEEVSGLREENERLRQQCAELRQWKEEMITGKKRLRDEVEPLATSRARRARRY